MVLHKQRFDVMMVSPWQTSTFVVSVYTRHLYLQMAGSDAALGIARLWTRTYTSVSVGRCQWLSKPEREQGLGGKRRQLYSLHQSHLLVGCDPVGFLATVKKGISSTLNVPPPMVVFPSVPLDNSTDNSSADL
jgi:hypothetical protein